MYKKAALIFPLTLMSQLSLADWVKDAAPNKNENQVIQLRQQFIKILNLAIWNLKHLHLFKKN